MCTVGPPSHKIRNPNQSQINSENINISFFLLVNERETKTTKQAKGNVANKLEQLNKKKSN